jgi:hypothetical protein
MIEIEIPKIKRTKLYLFGEKENKEREKERKKKTLVGDKQPHLHGHVPHQKEEDVMVLPTT